MDYKGYNERSCEYSQ